MAVLNPYAPALTFPDTTTRLRSDHEKYLTLIDTIALVHQHQREVKTMTRRRQPIEYVEATLDDIGSPMSWRTKCWAARSMSCRRRRAGS